MAARETDRWTIAEQATGPGTAERRPRVRGRGWRRAPLLAALLVALGLLALAAPATAQMKLAVVDLQGAMMRTEDGLRAAAALRRFTKNRQSDLDARQERLAREQDELRKQARLLSRKALQRRTEHWQRRMVAVQTKFIEYNKQLKKKQDELMAPIIRKMFAVVRRAASRRGVDMVMDRAAVPYARADLDLTDMVVQMYNSGAGDDGGGDKASKGGKDEPGKK